MDNKYVNKALELSSKVASNVYLDAISKGLMGTLPILIIGSIGCLLGVFPFDPYLQFIEKIGVKTYFLAASTVTTSCLSIYAAFLIGYRLAGSFKCDQIPAGLISVFAFFITTPLTKDSGLMMEFMGAKGLFGAMIAALIATRIYCAFMNVDKLKIKMPEQVPPGVARAFEVLVPATITLIITACIGSACYNLTGLYLNDVIKNGVQGPLGAVGATVPGVMIIYLVIMLFWLVGIHGNNMLSAVKEALFTPLALENVEAFNKGETPKNIINMYALQMWGEFGGSGVTIGLVIAIMIFGKREDNKAIASLSLVPGLFNINETVTFGIPMVLNPILGIPFVVAPLVTIIIGYVLTVIGFCPVACLTVPWTTPPIVFGFLATGANIMGAVTQAILIVVSTVIYTPFLIAYEKYQNKQAAEA